ncbi:MAG TPA: hypothetical protein PKO21_12670 [Verrucomicrobiota bacterium]|nr:hypothetical protein [Verrucomicrobiota bacterium]
MGQRIEALALDCWQNNGWVEFATTTSIGNCRLVREHRVTTTKLRLCIIKAAACPALGELGVVLEQSGT